MESGARPADYPTLILRDHADRVDVAGCGVGHLRELGAIVVNDAAGTSRILQQMLDRVPAPT